MHVWAHIHASVSMRKYVCVHARVHVRVCAGLQACVKKRGQRQFLKVSDSHIGSPA